MSGVLVSADLLERIAFDNGLDITFCADRAYVTHAGVRYVAVIPEPAS